MPYASLPQFMNDLRRLDVMRTPTVLVLDPAGRIVKRASGAPRRADVLGALGAVIEPSATPAR